MFIKINRKNDKIMEKEIIELNKKSISLISL